MGRAAQNGSNVLSQNQRVKYLFFEDCFNCNNVMRFTVPATHASLKLEVSGNSMTVNDSPKPCISLYFIAIFNYHIGHHIFLDVVQPLY